MNEDTPKHKAGRLAGIMSRAKYAKFHCLSRWMEEINRQPNEEAAGRLMFAIAAYGIAGEEPRSLTPSQMAYFNKEVRPELNRQHEKFKIPE